MLVRITHRCRMGCSHCQIRAGEDGEHMTEEIYRKVIDFSLEQDPLVLLLSGGEPTEHPQFVEFVEYAKTKSFKQILILSNGMFAEDEEYTKKILSLDVPVQVTNDERFYPKRVNKIDHPNLVYEDHIRLVSPFGRAVDNNLQISKQNPTCVNLRLVAMQMCAPALAGAPMPLLKDILIQLRMAMKLCVPSVDPNGDLKAGESSECQRIGTIWDDDNTIIGNILKECNKCGLFDNFMRNVDPAKFLFVGK